jgi:hypothetical protein
MACYHLAARDQFAKIPYYFQTKNRYGVFRMSNKKIIFSICERDCYPKVQIQGRQECVAEYLDHCIGGQRIVDMILSEGVVYYVFESGHKLPLFCFCCGEPLEYRDLAKSRKEILGRRLKSMGLVPVEFEDGEERGQFRLEFSKKGILSKEVYTSVSPVVAARMYHPPDCPPSNQKESSVPEAEVMQFWRSW